VKLGARLRSTGLGLLAASVAASPALAQNPVAQHRELGDGVDRPIHNLAGVGDSSSLELNPALLGSIRGFDLTMLGYQTLNTLARGAGFGAFAGLNLGWGFALGFGVQALEPTFGDGIADVDLAHNRPMTKLSFGLALGQGEWGSFGIGVHGIRRNNEIMRAPQADLGLVLRMTNYASFGAVARLGPANLRDPSFRSVLDLAGEIAVRPLGNHWLELAGGVLARVDQTDQRGFGSFRVNQDLLPYGRLALRYQGVEVAGEAQLIQTNVLDADTFAFLERATAVRGGVSVSLAWDYSSFGFGLHAGLGGGVDGLAYKAQFTTARQGRIYPARLLDAEPYALGKIIGQRGLIAVLRRLERAEAGGERSVIVIKADGFKLGWGAGQELRNAIRRVRDAGGHVYAYVEEPSLRDYWIASAAEAIYTHPAGQFDTVGIGTRRLYFRDALAKLGVSVEAVHVDEFKSAHENFTRNDRSEYDAIQRTELLEDTWEAVVHDIAQARGLAKAKVRAIVRAAPLGPDEAVELGFADAVIHRDELGKTLSAALGADVSLRSFPPTDAELTTWSKAPYIAVVIVEGTIINGDSRTIPLLDIVMTGGDEIARTLEAVRGDKACKGVLLRVDSGGGSAFASEVMWREVQRTHEAWEKDPKASPPIVVSMSDVAASGGYYIAAGANQIFAEPLTITGSIGVVFMHFDVSALMNMLGVAIDRIERGGPAVDMNSIFAPWSEAQLAKVQNNIDRTYQLFLARVAGGRGMTKAEVDKLARGRVWSGKRAKDIGLIDEFGGMREAIAELRQRSGVAQYKDLELRLLPRKLTLVQLILRGAGGLVVEPMNQAVAAKQGREQAKLPLVLDAAISRLPLSILFIPQDTASTIMPGEIAVE